MTKAITGGKNFMQRLGTLKVVASLSSSGKLMSLTANAEDVYNALTRSFEQELNSSSRLYQLFKLQKISRYKQACEEVGNSGLSKILVQLQDLYIFNDPHMPSTTGRVEKAYQNEVVSWAVLLGLLDEYNYSLRPRGYVLKSLIKEGQSALVQYIPSTNPFLLNVQEKIFFLYLMLDKDGDVLKRLLPKLEDLDGFFSRTDAGKPMRETLGEILYHASSDMSEDPQELECIQKLTRIKEALDRQWERERSLEKRKPGQREHQVTWRLESLVDLGLLNKEKPHLHSYKVSGSGHRLCSKLRKLDDVGEYLNNHFFECVNNIFSIGAKPACSSEVIQKHLVKAYVELRNPEGVAPIEEVILLGAIQAASDTFEPILFEVSQGREKVKKMQTEHPRKVRLTVDSRGEFAYLEIDEDFGSQLVNSQPGVSI